MSAFEKKYEKRLTDMETVYLQRLEKSQRATDGLIEKLSSTVGCWADNEVKRIDTLEDHVQGNVYANEPVNEDFMPLETEQVRLHARCLDKKHACRLCITLYIYTRFEVYKRL